MIEEPGHPTGTLRDPFRKEPVMLKTISAALIAVSVLAAPAIAATSGKTAQAPVTKSATTTAHVKKNPLNANAKMSRHHVRHHRHHLFHKKMAGKFHKSLKVSAKPVMHPAKRG
jgi:hypothetical protein